MATMEFKSIKKHYNDIEVLHDINLDIKDGEFIVLIGSSGCGKSTLLRMICGLEDITDGKLIINDKVANNIKPQERNMAMVFQSYALYPHMSVYDNISYGLKIKKESKDEIDKKVKDVASILGISNYLNRLPKNPALFSTSKPDVSPRSSRKPALDQRSTLIKHVTSMSYKLELVIWSRDTGQRIT